MAQKKKAATELITNAKDRTQDGETRFVMSEGNQSACIETEEDF